MEKYELNAVKIFNRQKSSLTKKAWATRTKKTSISWRNNVKIYTSAGRAKVSFDAQPGSRVMIPVNSRLFSFKFYILVTAASDDEIPKMEKARLEMRYTGSTLRFLGDLAPVECNIYESQDSGEIYLLYEGILFVAANSYREFRKRGLQTRLGELEYYDYYGFMDGVKGRSLPQGQHAFPSIDHKDTPSSGAIRDIQQSLGYLTRG